MSVGGGGDVAEGGSSRRGLEDPGADLQSPNKVWPVVLLGSVSNPFRVEQI
jgi:hypothetical protein